MAYKGKYARYRSSYRRGGKYRYSMYKLYKNRSSKAQSRQIYGLNKKIKWIQRRTRPEINIAPLIDESLKSDYASGDIQPETFSGAPLGIVIYRRELVRMRPDTYTGQLNAGEFKVNGRFARLQNLTIKGIFTYSDMSVAAVTDDGLDLQRMPAYLRIVLVQTRVTRTQYPGFNDVFQLRTSGSNEEATAGPVLSPYGLIRAPLAIGVSRVGKVVSDKTYSLSDTKQAVNVKTKLKYVRNWYQAPNEDTAKGNIFMFVMLYSQNPELMTTSHVQFNYVSKLVYTDA